MVSCGVEWFRVLFRAEANSDAELQDCDMAEAGFSSTIHIVTLVTLQVPLKVQCAGHCVTEPSEQYLLIFHKVLC